MLVFSTSKGQTAFAWPAHGKDLARPGQKGAPPAMIIAFWTLPLTLIFLWLSFRVIRYRRAERIPLGSGGNAALERAMRAHANFAEYVPFAMLMLVLAEWAGTWPWLLHALGALLVAARLSHGMGLMQDPEDYRFRVFGMMGTTATIGIAALAAFWGALMRG
jgi:uncharacterized membrane protein YecN with MAPEG domain